jgi:hypothetical protein
MLMQVDRSLLVERSFSSFFPSFVRYRDGARRPFDLRAVAGRNQAKFVARELAEGGYTHVLTRSALDPRSAVPSLARWPLVAEVGLWRLFRSPP